MVTRRQRAIQSEIDEYRGFSAPGCKRRLKRLAAKVARREWKEALRRGLLLASWALFVGLACACAWGGFVICQ